MSEEKKVLEKPVVLYDEQCRFCVSTTDALRRMDTDGLIDWRPLHDERTRRQFPSIDWHRAEEELHLIRTDGRVRTGARAVRDIAEVLGGEAGRAIAEMMDQPGLRDAADLVYGLVSKNRERISAAMDKAEVTIKVSTKEEE